MYTILGVVKRSRWPTSVEEAKAGGFVVGYMSSGNPIYRNPCSVQILKLLDNLLALIRWVKLAQYQFHSENAAYINTLLVCMIPLFFVHHIGNEVLS